MINLYSKNMNLPATCAVLVYDFIFCGNYSYSSLAASLAPYGSIFPGQPFPECSLIVDSGFSFAHVIPVTKGSILWDGVRRYSLLISYHKHPRPTCWYRIDVGGKLLTNQLASIISFNHYHVLDQTYMVNDIKEKCCRVSSSFADDLERCR